MKIPFNDLQSQHTPIRAEIDEAIASVVDDCKFIGKGQNPHVRSFEQAFAGYVGANHCVGCANGTDAIELALRAFDIGPGDEVIVPAQTWISTAESVSMTGAKPVFADISPLSHTIDPEQVERKITDKTRAIIPVHLCGLPANMHAISSIAKSRSLKVIEDCAQAHGAFIEDTHVGTFGDCGTFSFFPGKNLGAFGDAGCVVTNDPSIAEKIERLRDHGRGIDGNHDYEGRNSRLDGIQAAILSVKLRYLKDWVEQRQAAAARYLENIPSDSLVPQQTFENMKHAYHLFSIQCDNRDSLRTHLHANGIQTGIHYPYTLPELTAYRSKGARPENFPNATLHSKSSLSLPLFPGIAPTQIDYVIESLYEFTNPRNND